MIFWAEVGLEGGTKANFDLVVEAVTEHAKMFRAQRLAGVTMWTGITRRLMKSCKSFFLFFLKNNQE
jgi:hypothetical protein